MPRRIIEQCSRADFSSIEHLASIIDRPGQLDVSTLSKTQRAAIRFIILTQAKKIPWELVKDTIKAVLFWTRDGEHVMSVEIKWLQTKRNVDKVRRFKSLWEAT